MDESGLISRQSYSNSCIVHLDVAGDAVKQAEKMLAGIPKGVDKAIKSAMSRAASHLQTISGRTIRERYAISQANIRANENIRIKYKYQDGVQAEVIFSGQRIPLYRFDGAAPKQPTKDASAARGPVKIGGVGWRYAYPSVPARGHVLKSTSPYSFVHAFVANMHSTGHTGIFERTGGKTSSGMDELKELFGPAVPQMLGSQEVTF